MEKTGLVVMLTHQTSIGTDEALSGHVEGPELEAGLTVGTLGVAHLQPGQWDGVPGINK